MAGMTPEPSKWSRIIAADPEHSHRYIQRFKMMEANGHDLYGEARTVDGILRAVWLTPDELRSCSARHRSPLVWRCVADYLAGRRYPLDLLVELDASLG